MRTGEQSVWEWGPRSPQTQPSVHLWRLWTREEPHASISPTATPRTPHPTPAPTAGPGENRCVCTALNFATTRILPHHHTDPQEPQPPSTGSSINPVDRLPSSRKPCEHAGTRTPCQPENMGPVNSDGVSPLCLRPLHSGKQTADRKSVRNRQRMQKGRHWDRRTD